MVTTIIVLQPLFKKKKTKKTPPTGTKIILFSPSKTRSARSVRVSVKFLCRSTLSVMNLADDVLQLNLNAESKETRARRKRPELAVRHGSVPPSDAATGAERGREERRHNAMVEERDCRLAPPLGN